MSEQVNQRTEKPRPPTAPATTAVEPAQAPETVAWVAPSAARILGKRHPRIDGPAKVTGAAKYASDIVLPGMLHARVMRSPYAAARIASDADVDTSAAEKLPGVKAVIKLVGSGGKTIRYAGEEIAAVAAVSPEAADEAVRAIKVKYELRPFVVNEDKAANPAAPRVRGDLPNVEKRGDGDPTERGDVDAAFAKADAIHEGEYLAQTRLHCCLETHGSTVKWDGDMITAWISTQNVHGCRNQLARVEGAKGARVICHHMGGGFGSKFSIGSEGTIAARLSKLSGRPVKLMLTREDEQNQNYRGPGLRATVKLGVAKDGTLLASEVRTSNFGGTARAGTPLDTGYYIIEPEARRSYAEVVYTNTGGIAALRAPGHPQADLIWESALDDVAAKIDMDPLEFRRKNHNDPVRLAEWDVGAKIIGWQRRNKTPGSPTGTKKRGMGMASATWGGGGRAGSKVDIYVLPTGMVICTLGTQDLGTGARTYCAAIPAEELGLDISQVQAQIGDSAYGFSGGSGGSTTTPGAAPAVKMAAVAARQELAKLAAADLEVDVDQLEVRVGGGFQVKGQPEKRIVWERLCSKIEDLLHVEGEWNADLQQSGLRGCTFAEVEVDTETGRVRVTKIVGVQDCGYVLNRLLAESQIVGAITQGIGTALTEERFMDNLTGRQLNPNFEWYKLVGTQEIPNEVRVDDLRNGQLGADQEGVVAVVFDNPVGKVSGIGEPPLIPVHSAISNAVFNAIGVRVGEQPMTPDKVLAALAQKKGA